MTAKKKPTGTAHAANQATATRTDQPITLRENVQQAIRCYLEDMGSCQPDSLYRTLMAEVEPPLIEEVLRYTEGNQSRSAKILGMTRNTLRAKLVRYDIPVGNGNGNGVRRVK